MSRRLLLVIAVTAVALVALLWAVWPQPEGGRDQVVSKDEPMPTPTPPPPQRVTLLYPGGDGLLHPVLVELALPDEPELRVEMLVERLLGEAPGGRARPAPYEAVLLDVFVTDGGTAFVDLTGPEEELEGSATELMFVYAVVNSILLNSPTLKCVQLLFDGHEIGTLTGHLDMSRPLPLNKRFIGS